MLLTRDRHTQKKENKYLTIKEWSHTWRGHQQRWQQSLRADNRVYMGCSQKGGINTWRPASTCYTNPRLNPECVPFVNASEQKISRCIVHVWKANWKSSAGHVWKPLSIPTLTVWKCSDKTGLQPIGTFIRYNNIFTTDLSPEARLCTFHWYVQLSNILYACLEFKSSKQFAFLFCSLV